MAIETKDWVGWSVTGGLGLLRLFLNWRTRLDAKKRERSRAESVWSLRQASLPLVPGDIALNLTLEEASAQRLRLLTITAKKPRRLEIAEIDWPESRKDFGSPIYVPLSYKKQLKIDRDLDPAEFYVPSGFRRTSVTINFFVRVLTEIRRPIAPSRVVIRIELEGITARAEQKAIVVRSELIEWEKARTLEDALE